MRHYIVALALVVALAVPAVASAAPLVVKDQGNLDIMTWLIVKDEEWTKDRLDKAVIPQASKDKIAELITANDRKLRAVGGGGRSGVLPKPASAVYTADHDLVIAATARSMGLAENEIEMLIAIHHRESHDPTAVSKSGSYFGAFQLSASKVQGVAWWDPAVNTTIAINYIRARYGTVAAAYQHSLTHNWY